MHPTVNSIGIVGGGVVGQATARSFIEHVDQVKVYDLVKSRSTHDLQSTINCDLVFICLPTPSGEDGKLDLTAIKSFFAARSASDHERRFNYVIKSTVPIGTTSKLAEIYRLTNLVHSPEFLTARCATIDAQLPSRNIIGTVGYELRFNEGQCWDVLFQLYRRRFPGTQIMMMKSDESEAVKIFQNSFFAVKVAFWNEVNELASKLGLTWDNIMRGILSDGRISPSHTNVPGPDGKYGFGGTCLPKDLGNLVKQSKENGLNPLVCSAAIVRNHMLDRERK